MKQLSFFAEETRLTRLTSMGDPLEKVTETVDFELFRPVLDKVFQKTPAAPGGRPPRDYVLMLRYFYFNSGTA